MPRDFGTAVDNDLYTRTIHKPMSMHPVNLFEPIVVYTQLQTTDDELMNTDCRFESSAFTMVPRVTALQNSDGPRVDHTGRYTH